jgi:hypothetical protein
MGFALRDVGNDPAVLFHVDLLSVAGPGPLAQKPPGCVLPDAVDHIEDHQKKAVAGGFCDGPVQGAVPELTCVGIGARCGFLRKSKQALNIAIGSAQGGKSGERRLNLKTHIHHLEGVGALR